MDDPYKLSKKVLRCNKCNKPLAEMVDNTIRILSFYGGKKKHVCITVKHSKGGVINIECEDCKGQVIGHQFITLVAPKE